MWIMCTLLRFSLDSSCGRSIEGGDTVPLAVPTLSLWLSGNFSRIPHPWYLTARARDQWPSLEIRYTKVAEIQFKCFNPLWFTIPLWTPDRQQTFLEGDIQIHLISPNLHDSTNLVLKMYSYVGGLPHMCTITL